ncbi:MAG: hypothetical protein NT148_00015 [Candidatus Nealsonbacteria bacterium]|nr:hypothetical protein [Candidatus Nealsonbacteria bacterium]
MKNILSRKNNEKGIAIIYILVFSVIFLILFTVILNFILFELKINRQSAASDQAFFIAEAGVEYYQWCLNHGIENCDTNKDYYNSNGKFLGNFLISATKEVSCGETIRRQVTVTGITSGFLGTQRKIDVIYGRPSVAKYSYVVAQDVWAGDDRQIRGLYHSNGGVRMDGTNYSLVTSSQSEWTCTSSFGCDSCPTDHGCRLSHGNCICPGVFTTTNNANTGLFDYPNTSFSFTNILIQLKNIKDAAVANNSYFQPSINLDSHGKGYHVILKNNGTYEVWIITGLNHVSGYSDEGGWQEDYFIISGEYKYGTYNVNPTCGVAFFEDNLWIEGILKGKMTIASAWLIDASKTTSIVLPGNINYTVTDGTDLFGLISQQNILISPNSPDNMIFGRNHYLNNIKTLLQMFGSTVSNDRTGTQWTSGGSIVSGYRTREDYVDNNLIYGAPPYMPHLESNFRVIRWQEKR